MTGLPLTLRRWTRHEYERLVDLGLFQRDPVELTIHANPGRQTAALTLWNVIGGNHGRFALRSESDE